MRRRVAIGLMVLVGCRGPAGPAGSDGIDGEPFPPPHVFGTYELVSVNGNPLPYRFATGQTSSHYFVAGSVSLNANMTYVRSTAIMIVTTANDTTLSTTVQSGLFTNDDGDISLDLGNSVEFPGIVYRNTLTLNPTGAETYVYRR